MASHAEDDPDVKGIGKLFNSTTIKGRANVSLCLTLNCLRVLR